MGWCGVLDGAPTWDHYTFSPCLLETVVGSLLLFVAAVVLVFQCRKVSLLRRRRYIGSTQWTRQTVISAVSFGTLTVTHLAVLVTTSILVGRSGTAAPYNVYSEAALFIVWLAAMVCSCPEHAAHEPVLSTLHLCTLMSTIIACLGTHCSRYPYFARYAGCPSGGLQSQGCDPAEAADVGSAPDLLFGALHEHQHGCKTLGTGPFRGSHTAGCQMRADSGCHRRSHIRNLKVSSDYRHKLCRSWYETYTVQRCHAWREARKS